MVSWAFQLLPWRRTPVARSLLVAVGFLAMSLGVLACSGGVDVEGLIRAETEEWWGTPYKWGQATLEGVDCSGFTQAVFADALSTELPRTTEQQERLGLEVHRDSLSAGDLVFFRTGGFLGLFKKRHVGIYLSAGDFAHASSSQGVTISSLEDPFWRKEYKTARRILDERGTPMEPLLGQ